MIQETLLSIDSSCRPVVNPAKEAAGYASQIVEAARVAETLGAALLEKEALKNKRRNISVVTRITIEAANGPAVNVEAVVKRLLRDIFDLEQVLDNKNALTILTVIFKQFPFRSILLLIVAIFLRTRSNLHLPFF